VPTDWELAPYTSDSIAVIKAHQWSTYSVVLANGYTYYTAASVNAGSLYTYYGLYTYGYAYAVRYCYAQILIRKKVPDTSSSVSALVISCDV